MTTSYPELTDAELRAQFQHSDQLLAQKILRFMLASSLPLLYLDFVLLGLGLPFFIVGMLRLSVMAYAWWILKKCGHPTPFSHLEYHLCVWSGLALTTQFASDFLAPLTYLGHFVIDSWICIVASIVLPIRAAYSRRLLFAYLFAVILLSLTKIFPSSVFQVSVFTVLLLSAYAGQVVATTMHKFRRKLLSAEFELQRKEITDPLTGVINRREFLRIMESEMARHVRLSKPLSILILDVEDLKRINSQYGAGTVDIVLVEMSKRMQRATRNYDCLARYGTEEFVVLLPEATSEIAAKVAKRALNTIAAMPVPIAGKEVRVGAHVGVATMREADTIENILKRAEDDLLHARVDPNSTISNVDLAYA